MPKAKKNKVVIIVLPPDPAWELMDVVQGIKGVEQIHMTDLDYPHSIKYLVGAKYVNEEG